MGRKEGVGSHRLGWCNGCVKFTQNPKKLDLYYLVSIPYAFGSPPTIALFVTLFTSQNQIVIVI